MASGGEVPTRAATYDEPFFSSPDAKTVNKVAAYVESNSEPHTATPTTGSPWPLGSRTPVRSCT